MAPRQSHYNAATHRPKEGPNSLPRYDYCTKNKKGCFYPKVALKCDSCSKHKKLNIVCVQDAARMLLGHFYMALPAILCLVLCSFLWVITKMMARVMPAVRKRILLSHQSSASLNFEPREKHVHVSSQHRSAKILASKRSALQFQDTINTTSSREYGVSSSQLHGVYCRADSSRGRT